MGSVGGPGGLTGRTFDLFESRRLHSESGSSAGGPPLIGYFEKSSTGGSRSGGAPGFFEDGRSSGGSGGFSTEVALRELFDQKCRRHTVQWLSNFFQCRRLYI